MGSSKYPNLGFDPAPGDLETVKLMVSVMGRVTRDSGTAQTHLSKIGAADGIWAGKSANVFTESVDKIPPYLKKALNSVSSAHRALSGWETSLEGFQARARKLEEEASAAAQRASAAKGNLDSLPNDTSKMSDREKEEHEKDEKGKRKAYDTANDELEDVRRRARSLYTEYTHAADSTARTIKDAADDAPPEPGWFDDLVDGFKEFLSDAWKTLSDPNFWKAVGDMLADLAMVIGVLAMIGVPGLGLIGLLVAGGALAAHAGAMLGGAEGVTWQTLAWDAAGLFAGARAFKGLKVAKQGKGLMKAGKALKAAGQANARAGEALRLGKGFAASVGKAGRNIFKQSPWKNMKGIGEGMRNSLKGFRQTNLGYRQIGQGERQIAAGREMVARGSTMDARWTQAGVGLAGGSNMNGGRWLDGDWNMADIPVVGTAPPLLDYDYGHHSGPSQALSSAGGTFAGGLQPAGSRVAS
ncbi:putative T7SS-secreted protein [Streptomyces sp. enrichment culture]|uniref:putative T7SS-secreted protein n=1 Tax=Streptomyces sp. enrichment culture TaxID=1795815 RepID=UPI003F557066